MQMASLAAMKSEQCRDGTRTATRQETEKYLRQLPGWDVVRRDGEQQLKRAFAFSNFSKAMAFANEVGQLAGSAGHHPGLLTEWGKVTVTWWSYKIGGLHRADFVMAAKTDQLYNG